MAQYFCRVCENTNGWVSPTNSARETTSSHHGKFSFGYEEWNFSPHLLIAGWQYGWIEGFRSGPGRRDVAPSYHEVILYVRRNGQSLAVGKIRACEKLASTVAAPAYPAALAREANGVGAMITVVGSNWSVSPTVVNPGMAAYVQTPLPNCRFKPSDAYLFAVPITIPIPYTRYGALLVTPTNRRAAIWGLVP